MSQEFTIYTLFILLTVSMGIIFQFMLAKINSLKATQKTIMKAMSGINKNVMDIRNNKIIDSPKVIKNSTWRGADTLKGNLTLEYRGAIADTRATFMLDKE